MFCTIALALSLTASYDCKFLYAELEYCAPPEDGAAAQAVKSKFACCGGCHCIPENPYDADGGCPTVGVPNMNISRGAIERFKAMEHLNPMNLTCNPYDTQYTGVPCETSPPQLHTELGDAAACGVIYDTTSLDPDQCPTRYRLESFESVGALDAAGAELTHHGACGVCSSKQDLAVYVENVDLTTLGVECSIAGILEFEKGVRCYQRAGYTRVRCVSELFFLLRFPPSLGGFFRSRPRRALDSAWAVH